MRLLDARTGMFSWIGTPTESSYAVFSCSEALGEHAPHWDIHDDGTPNLKTSLLVAEGGGISTSNHRLPALMRHARSVASKAGVDHVWLPGCSIDNTDDAESSATINDMWDWYSHAEACYAYLGDVYPAEEASAPASQFCQSRWFKDTWTLQALLAPASVVFLARDLSVMGTKETLATAVQAVTGIDQAFLSGERSVHSASVAQRMSWASRRRAQRVEDTAYSLLGLFGVRMSVEYGEGPRAFARLQEEILRAAPVPDQSIFAWHFHRGHAHPDALLAYAPCCFARSGGVRPLSPDDFAARLGLPSPLPPLVFTLIPTGVAARLPLVPHEIAFYPPTTALYDVFGVAARFSHATFLQCIDEKNALVVLALAQPHDRGQQGHDEYAVKAVETTLGQCDRVWSCSPALCRDAIALRDVTLLRTPLQVPWIAHATPSRDAPVAGERPPSTQVILEPASREALESQGYAITHETHPRELVDDLYARSHRARRFADVHRFVLVPAAGRRVIVELVARRHSLAPMTLARVAVRCPERGDVDGAGACVGPLWSRDGDGSGTFEARYGILEGRTLSLRVAGRTGSPAAHVLNVGIEDGLGSAPTGAICELGRESVGVATGGRVMDVFPRLPSIRGWTSRSYR